jgi:predicted RNase H-like nuclease
MSLEISDPKGRERAISDPFIRGPSTPSVYHRNLKGQPMKTQAKANTASLIILTEIARKHLHIETLETQNSDRLDFHDVAVWGVLDALQAAFAAGRASIDLDRIGGGK